jgi:hypothetical protein
VLVNSLIDQRIPHMCGTVHMFTKARVSENTAIARRRSVTISMLIAMMNSIVIIADSLADNLAGRTIAKPSGPHWADTSVCRIQASEHFRRPGGDGDALDCRLQAEKDYQNAIFDAILRKTLRIIGSSSARRITS